MTTLTTSPETEARSPDRSWTQIAEGWIWSGRSFGGGFVSRTRNTLSPNSAPVGIWICGAYPRLAGATTKSWIARP